MTLFWPRPHTVLAEVDVKNDQIQRAVLTTAFGKKVEVCRACGQKNRVELGKNSRCGKCKADLNSGIEDIVESMFDDLDHYRIHYPKPACDS